MAKGNENEILLQEKPSQPATVSGTANAGGKNRGLVLRSSRSDGVKLMRPVRSARENCTQSGNKWK